MSWIFSRIPELKTNTKAKGDEQKNGNGIVRRI